MSEIRAAQRRWLAPVRDATTAPALTTGRRTEAVIRARVARDDRLVGAIRVADNFGDYGPVGEAAGRGAKALAGRHVATQKNDLASDVYPRHALIKTGPGAEHAERLDVTPTPDHILVRRDRQC